MRAPTLYLITLLLAGTSCGQKAEAPPSIARGPQGGADEEAPPEGEKTAEAAPTADPAAAIAPEPMPTPNQPAPPPAFPTGSTFAQPVVTGTNSGGDAGLALRGEFAVGGPATPGPDSLAAAIGVGWRDAKPKRDDDGESDDREPEEPAKNLELTDLEVAKPAAEDDGKDRERARKGTVEEAPADELEETKKEAIEDLRASDGDFSRFKRGAHTVVAAGEDPEMFVAPATTLPRMFYFENTYLGGSAAYAERLRRLDQALQGQARPYEIVQAEVQPFDAPRTEGLGLTASIDATHFERARRVFLQVGLRGSSRYGWRRPPLDIVLVVDQPAFARGSAFVTRFVVDLLRQLGPADRLGIVLAGDAAPTFLDLARLNTAQQHLANRIDQLAPPAATGTRELADAMRKAGVMLDEASDDEATVPGTKTLMVLSGEHDQGRIAEAAQAAHQLTVEGCVTSVFALDAEQSEWWQVANAGFGNLHRINQESFAPALEEEMQSLARVVARLVRVNVRLGKDAKAIRVLGTRVLEQREVEQVKARELATDINLSKSLGITSDRGEDDDGIQTVIPYFYGDDSHVILIELWVEGPGAIADVTVRYKDMVNLDNATARTSVRIGARPQAPTQEQVLIARNVRGFQLAENLQKASDAVYLNDFGSAVYNLGAAKAKAAETNAMDVQAIEGLKAMVERGDWQNNATQRATLQETLLISGQRRVGDTNKAATKK